MTRIEDHQIAIIHTDSNGLYHWTPAEFEYLDERGAGFRFKRDCLLSIRESSKITGCKFTHYKRLGRIRKIPPIEQLMPYA